ncbi:hypothetical protein J3U21_06265 [Gilliamella sp. B2776]|uniref:hypothetical protein n=1 Tax=unclassified Gilliamella TaxID=2685620 RepID=UPI002269F140|nr:MULTISPECIES: hypothetical protein [unclassified Gilliamella]MCX8649980.1 hypothetical protein [Gilliamella sp. B2779]MCX8654913.1 hypothetical protein [Gilliamella sp. B2737]MCX8656556.1 hypothetical protein [Gilliamella sp. B2894]MCX8691753.1 hypothetical protein [Gilliamella sp. B2776]MCX8693132.1 hypothetical protein [Gilliamella sp. B2881]
MKKKFKQRKQHYFLFAYKFQCANGKDGYGCKTISKNNINVTQTTFNCIWELLKKDVDDVENMIITSVNYLGYMTEKEFNDN